MEAPGGLMTMYGLGLFVYLQDRFSRTAASVQAQALGMEKSMGVAAAGISRSAAMMGSGLALAAAGIAGLKIGDALAKQAQGIDDKVRELRIKGFSKEESDKIKRQVLDLGAEMGVLPQVAINAALRSAEYGLKTADEMLPALRTIFRASIGTQSDVIANTDAMLMARRSLGMGLGELASLSGKAQIGADELATSFNSLMQEMPLAVSTMSLYNMSLDDMLALLAAAKVSGYEASRTLSGMQRAFWVLQAGSPKTDAALGKIANGEALAAIKAGEMGKGLRILSAEMAKVPSAERTTFLKSLGIAGRQAGVVYALIKHAGTAQEVYAKLGDALGREQRSFAEQSEGYGHQLDIQRARMASIGSLIGAAVRSTNAPFLAMNNRILLGVRQFIAANSPMVGAVAGTTRTLSRMAVVSGLSAAGLGLLRFGLKYAKVEGAATAGTFRLLGMGISSLLSKIGPTAAIFLAITGAVKGLQYAYRNNYIGFKDWTDKTVKGTLLVGRAVFESFRHIRVEGGKAMARLPEDLMKELQAAGLLDVAKMFTGVAWDVKALGAGFMGGLKDTLLGPEMTESMGLMFKSMGESMSTLTGRPFKTMDYSTFLGVGKGAGVLAGGIVGTLIFAITGATSATLLLAATIKQLIDMFPKWAQTPPLTSKSAVMGATRAFMAANTAADFLTSYTSPAGLTPRNVGDAYRVARAEMMVAGVVDAVKRAVSAVMPASLNLTTKVMIEDREIGRSVERVALGAARSRG
jgi:hypothetical protein